ncbi:hypothetical protein ACEPAG_1267 [Sanghuangporus baumii]
MASTADSIPNKIILLAEVHTSKFPDVCVFINKVNQVTVKPDKVDEMQRFMANSHKHSNSDDEPGCLTFRCARYGNKVVFFEEYADKAALAKHFETEPFKAFSAAVPDLVVGEPKMSYFEEFTSQ